MLDSQTQSKRAHPRFKVRLEGRLLSLDGMHNYDCTIEDLSEGGACVSTRYAVTLPARMFLFERQGGDTFECEVRWQRDRQVGLRFIDAATRSQRRTLLELCKAAG